MGLTHVSGDEVNDEASDELLSVRSLRNWFRIPEPSMIARVSKRGKINSFFDIPDSKMVARVSKKSLPISFLNKLLDEYGYVEDPYGDFKNMATPGYDLNYLQSKDAFNLRDDTADQNVEYRGTGRGKRSINWHNKWY